MRDRPTRSRPLTRFATYQVEVTTLPTRVCTGGQLTARVKCHDGEVYIGPDTMVSKLTGYRVKANEEIPITSESPVYAVTSSGKSRVSVYVEYDS